MAWVVESLPVEDKDAFILHNQYHGCWRPIEGISNHCIDFILLEYSAFCTKMALILIVRQFSAIMCITCIKNHHPVTHDILPKFYYNCHNNSGLCGDLSCIIVYLVANFVIANLDQLFSHDYVHNATHSKRFKWMDVQPIRSIKWLLYIVSRHKMSGWPNALGIGIHLVHEEYFARHSLKGASF